jgi:hypothetical protein
MSELIDIIDTEKGIQISKILSKDSADYSSIIEVFYESLSNINSIEELYIVNNWKDIFPHTNEKPMIVSLLKLFLNYISENSISYNTQETGKIYFENLTDTRNVFYENALFLNCTQGILPQAKSINFLFTEKQRQLLDLKTIDDIQLREKYYFFRTILNSNECFLISIQNIDENIEKSPFIEEIKRYLHNITQTEELICTSYKDFFIDRINEISLQTNITENSNFYIFPSDFKTDFILPNKIYLTPSNITYSLNNVIEWYFTEVLKISKYIKTNEDNSIYIFLGNIIHIFIQNIINTYNCKTFGAFISKLNNDDMDKIFYEKIAIQEYLKFPQDYNGTYIKNILYPIIKKRIIRYFNSTDFNEIERDSLIYTELEMKEASLLKTEKYEIIIKGRIDMLITNDRNTHIIDIKSGKADETQLEIYKWLTEVNLNINLNKITTHTLQIFANDKTIKGKSIEHIKDSIKEIFDNISKYGYYYPKKNDNFTDITRSNIFKEKKPDFWKILQEFKDEE